MVNLLNWCSELLRMITDTMQIVFTALTDPLSELTDISLPAWLGDITILQVIFGSLLTTIVVYIVVKWVIALE